MPMPIHFSYFYDDDEDDDLFCFDFVVICNMFL